MLFTSDKSGVEIVGWAMKLCGLTLMIFGIVKTVGIILYLLEAISVAAGNPGEIVLTEDFFVRLFLATLPIVVGTIMNIAGTSFCRACQYDPNTEFTTTKEDCEENAAETDAKEYAEEELEENSSVEEIPADEPKEIKPLFNATWKCEYCGSVSEDVKFACGSCGAARPY